MSTEAVAPDQVPYFRSVLVANRGEIAVRVISALRSLGITAIAVYAEDDANAPHRKLADEAYALGDGTVAETYLDAERIIAIAKDAGAEAIHPGYGFLSRTQTSSMHAKRLASCLSARAPHLCEPWGQRSRREHGCRPRGFPSCPVQ